MQPKVKWGVLGVARIATKKVIPGMQRGQWSEVVAIASRDADRARAAAAELGIPRCYGSYEELLADPEIEAVYNPLPNHLHVPWSLKAAQAGKHVLCEKPIALSAAEARQLLGQGVKIGEAFMVHTHPQWVRAIEAARAGTVGDIRGLLCAFSYFNDDPANIRNVPEWGGGALMDIGCYPIHVSRWLFGAEPVRVCAAVQRDPKMGVDRLTSAILEYPSGHAVFTVGTQMVPYQTVQILGSKDRIGIEIPFNAPPDHPCRILINDKVEEIPTCDQYTVQGDAFSRAIRGVGEVPVPIEDAIRNMEVLDALFRSAESGRWEQP